MLAWMDLEMTGLDPSRHVIVEIASLVTDDDLTIVAEGPDLVVHATPAQLAEMDDFVTAMHTRSGLLEAMAASTLTPRGGRSPDPGVPQAAHSRAPHRSAGRELHRYRPALPGRPAARDRGVPPLPLGGRLDPQGALPALVPGAAKAAPEKKGGHRALQDIQESVAELAFYRTAIFIPTPAPTHARTVTVEKDPPPVSLAEANATLTAAGQLFEMEERIIRGVPTRTWKNAPASLRAVLDLSLGYGDATYLVYEDERTSFAEHYRIACTLAHGCVDQFGVDRATGWPSSCGTCPSG